MTDLERYADLFRRTRKTADYWTELSIMQFTSGLRRLMGPMTQTELAQKMGVSEAYVSNVLRGRDNLTIEQMNKIASHLDAAVHIHVARRGSVVTWREETQPEGIEERKSGAPR